MKNNSIFVVRIFRVHITGVGVCAATVTPMKMAQKFYYFSLIFAKMKRNQLKSNRKGDPIGKMYFGLEQSIAEWRHDSKMPFEF